MEEKIRRGEDDKNGANDAGHCMEEGQRKSLCQRRLRRDLGEDKCQRY